MFLSPEQKSVKQPEVVSPWPSILVLPTQNSYSVFFWPCWICRLPMFHLGIAWVCSSLSCGLVIFVVWVLFCFGVWVGCFFLLFALFLKPGIIYASGNVINFVLFLAYLFITVVIAVLLWRLRPGLKINTLGLLSSSLCSCSTVLLCSQERRAGWMRREVRRESELDLWCGGLAERK